MEPGPRKGDTCPINCVSNLPHSQPPADQPPSSQLPARALSLSGNQNPAVVTATASRLPSSSSQSATATFFYNPPPIASPLPKEFRDRWRVVDTSGFGGPSSERATSDDRILYSPTLKRKFGAIVANNGSRTGSAAGTSHRQAAPLASGPGSANNTALNSPQQLVRREATAISPSRHCSPSKAAVSVPKPVLAPQQPTTRSEDIRHPSPSLITIPSQSYSKPQNTTLSQPNTSKHNAGEFVTAQARDGLTNGVPGPSSLTREKEPTMPLWPLPHEYQVGGPTASPATSVQELPSGKRYHPQIPATNLDSSLANTATSERSAVLACEVHLNTGANDGEDDCDCDCFEEYDPFDDVVELREALAKQGQRRNKSQLPRPSSPELRSPRKTRNSKPDLSRRPYLSLDTRSYFRDGNIPHLDSMIGQRLHVSFTEKEAKRVWLSAYIICRSFAVEDFSIEAGIASLRRLLESSKCTRNEKYEAFYSISNEAALDLQGRNHDDVSRYMAEVLGTGNDPLIRSQDIIIVSKDKPRSETSWSSLILARQCTDGMSIRRNVASHGHLQVIGSRKSLRFLQPFRIFTEGSSDVVDCAWDNSGQNFALACTTYNDMYNREGNLMLGDVYGSIKFLCGHKTRRPANQGNAAILDPYLHSTVSSVDFSGDLLFSSGFDKTVKIWDKKDRMLENTLSFGSRILRMKMSHVSPNTGAVCLENGQVVIFRPSLAGEGLYARCPIPARQDYVEPASVLWMDGQGRSNWIFVGYENKASDKRQPNAYLGDLRLYDVVEGKEVQEIRPGSTRQFDISLSERGSFLVTGAISGPARGPNPDTHSFVRLYDLREPPFRKKYEFCCQHRDINKVTISPCERYVTSSGTNGKSYLWDIRFGGEPLHELGHGVSRAPQSPDSEEEPTGVTFASWAADGGLFVTGSSDGTVKVWDPARAEPFLYDLATFDGPVMTGAFSPDGDCLVIGETTGKATLLSYMGRHGPPEPFVQDRSMLAPIASENQDS